MPSDKLTDHPRLAAQPVAKKKTKRRELTDAPTVADSKRRRSARIAHKEPEPEPEDLFEAGKTYTLQEILGKVGGVVMM